MLVRIQQLNAVDRPVWSHINDQFLAQPNAFHLGWLLLQADVDDVVTRIVTELLANSPLRSSYPETVWRTTIVEQTISLR